MNNQNNKPAQNGFTVVSLLLVAVLIVIVYFAARFVSIASEDNQKQADKLSSALGNEKHESSGDPADYEIPDSPSSDKRFDIRSVNLKIDVYFVQITARLPGTYTGTCRAEVEKPDGSGFRRFVEEIENKDNCIITIPIGRLDGSDSWQFQVSFVSSDGKETGTHPASTFSL